MRFFLDNSISPKLEAVLRALDVDAVHVKNVDGLARSAPDTVWIPVVAKNGWVAIGGDVRILRRPVERACVLDHGLIYFAFSSGFAEQQQWPQVLAVVKAWPRIEELAARARPQDCFEVTWSTGKIEPFAVRRR